MHTVSDEIDFLSRKLAVERGSLDANLYRSPDEWVPMAAESVPPEKALKVLSETSEGGEHQWRAFLLIWLVLEGMTRRSDSFPGKGFLEFASIVIRGHSSGLRLFLELNAAPGAETADTEWGKWMSWLRSLEQERLAE